MTVFSNGPDPTRGDVRCSEFHIGTTDPYDQGGCYNCCCCDPCRYIRPHGQVGVGHVWDAESVLNYCCKCVPRVLFLVFEPADTEDECCKRIGKALFVQRPATNEYYNFYQGTLFDVTVRVEVGRVIGGSYDYDYGYGGSEDATCGWKIITTVQAAGYGESDVQEFEIEHADTTCLYVPTGIDLAQVEGPNGCMGTLVLYDVEKSKIPFEKRQDITPDDGNFLALDEYSSCGDCLEVCSVMCVTGMRHEGDTEVERREFVWFDDREWDYGTDQFVGERGWAWLNPSTGFTERFLLTDEYGECVITPNLEDGDEMFSPQTLDQPCSCGSKVVFSATVGGEIYVMTLRCGWCSCWDFLCGTARCVPLELCAMYWDGSEMHFNVFMQWNGDAHSWESQTAEDDFTLLLRADDLGRCEIVPYVNGEQVDMTYPIWDCGSETIHQQFSGEHDIVSVSGTGYVSPGYGYDDVLFWFNASSLMASCIKAPCNICSGYCGSSPETLTVTVTQWTEPGDASGITEYQECVAEFTLYFVQQINGFDDDGPNYYCSYLGFGKMGDTDVRVELFPNTISFSEVPAWQSGFRCVVANLIDWVPTCDPIYWDSGDIYASTEKVFDKACMTCDPETLEDTYHLRIVVTE